MCSSHSDWMRDGDCVTATVLQMTVIVWRRMNELSLLPFNFTCSDGWLQRKCNIGIPRLM